MKQNKDYERMLFEFGALNYNTEQLYSRIGTEEPSRQMLTQFQEKNTIETPFFSNLIDNFLNDKIDINKLIVDSKEWFHNELANAENFDWSTITTHIDGNDIPEYIHRYSHKMSDEHYWSIIGHCYLMTGLPHTDIDTVLEYINADRPKREYMMTEEDREFFKNLPDEVTIYRGCSKDEIESGELRLSWSLDRKIAEYFAYEYINFNFEDSLDKDKDLFDVIEKTVPKTDLIAYFSDRKESEVLYLPKTIN